MHGPAVGRAPQATVSGDVVAARIGDRRAALVSAPVARGMGVAGSPPMQVALAASLPLPLPALHFDFDGGVGHSRASAVAATAVSASIIPAVAAANLRLSFSIQHSAWWSCRPVASDGIWQVSTQRAAAPLVRSRSAAWRLRAASHAM
jgi:hypothetical protein